MVLLKAVFPFTGTNILANKWTHIAVTYDGNDATCYVNGVNKGTRSFDKTLINASRPFTIGANGSASPGDFFAGEIDEVRLWNSVRTEARTKYKLPHTNR